MSLAAPPEHARERRFLVAALRAFLNGKRPADDPSLHGGALDWDSILRRAEEERLAGLLYTVLRPLSRPVPILEGLRTAWVAGTRQHLLGVEQLREVLPAFEREGIPAIPLKGPALAEALYGAPGLRPFTDLDLLIRPTDVPRALRLLSALGYQHLAGGRPLEYELAYTTAACFVRAQEGLPLDLHWDLLNYPGVRPVVTLEFGEVWGRAVKAERWGFPTLELCPEDLLIYLALHWAVHHALAGLLWPLDLALLLRRHGPQLDWEAVAERARRWRVAVGLSFALCQMEDQLAVGVPLQPLARLRPGRPRSAVLDWLRRTDERLGRLDHLIPLFLADRGTDLLGAIARDMFPPPGWARFRYGKDSLLGAYVAHYRRIGKVCLRTVRAALGR